MPHIVGRREVDRFYDSDHLVIVEEVDWQDWQYARPPYTQRQEKRVNLTPGEIEYLRQRGSTS